MEIKLLKGWAEFKLDDLLESLESGSRPRGGVRGIGSGTPSIGGEHLNDDGSFNFSNIKYVPESFAAMMKRGHINRNDILIVKDGATTGKVSFVDRHFPYMNAVVNEHVFICRPNKEIDPKYLFYYLWSREGKERILENFKGSAQGGINSSFSSNTIIPVAPKEEQQRIVSKLDALFDKIENNKQRLERIPQIIKRFRRSVLAAAVTGKLTEDWREKNPRASCAKDLIISLNRELERDYSEALKEFKIGKRKKPKKLSVNASNPLAKINIELPSNWAITRIGDISECLDYLRRPVNRIERNKRAGNIPYFGANGQVGWIDDYIFDEELVIVVEDETFIGREIPFCYIIKGKTWVNNHAHVLRPLGEISVDYLNICWSFYDFTSLTSGTTGRRKLTQESLLSAEFPIAPLEEQREIVNRVSQLFSLLVMIENRFLKSETQLNNLPRNVLFKAFHGELVAQNPDDEPASVLLERIKAERDLTKIQSKQKKKT